MRKEDAHIQIAQDTTKTKSSMRTLPLVPAFKEKLLKLKEQQEEYRRVCGRCYNKKYLECICVDEMGTLISPHYLTASFPKLLEKNNLRHIRFHDLRHSCASLLLANGVPMKQNRNGSDTAIFQLRQMYMPIWITIPSCHRLTQW